MHISKDKHTTTLSLHDVLNLVLKDNTSLKIKRLEEKNLQLDAAVIKEQLDPHASIKSTLSDETTPTTNPFAPSGTNIGVVTANITQPLDNGANVSLSASYSRSKTSYPSSVPSVFQATINPTYQHQIDLIYRYPLFKGHDNLAYQAQLETVSANEHAAHWQVAIEKEQLAAQAIQLFFQLAANQIAIQLSKDAVLRAQKFLAYQKKREHLGLIEKADRIQAEALLSGRKFEFINAQTTWNNSRVSLNRLMHRYYQAPLQLTLSSNTSVQPQSMPILISEAQKHRAIFMLLDAQEKASHALLTQARENERQQLDVIGQIGTRALSGSPLTVLGQGFTLKDRYLGVGIEWSDSLAKHALKPNIQKAELALERIQLQRQQAIENIITNISEARMQYENAFMTQASAQQRVQMEKKKFNAEMQRYHEGRSDTATVIQFEGALRNAELQASLQKIQMQSARYRIELAIGRLLSTS
ncbi:MAG: TolC family protein [Mariprofundaceae bacterium]|nr:TolC family protein [Mariprofundaceae bacterium]